MIGSQTLTALSTSSRYYIPIRLCHASISFVVLRITDGVHDEMRHVGKCQGIGGWADVHGNALFVEEWKDENALYIIT